MTINMHLYTMQSFIEKHKSMKYFFLTKQLTNMEETLMQFFIIRPQSCGFVLF